MVKDGKGWKRKVKNGKGWQWMGWGQDGIGTGWGW